ncbi:MAG: inositol monophosphatase, partial [Akkermansiaceae bacterium]|nr:inositol monophosphatase [Akkermansiaceae bacterium]
MTDLELATHAALEAGKLLRTHFGTTAVVDEASHHDLKLALDKQSQDLITGILLGSRPGDAL